MIDYGVEMVDYGVAMIDYSVAMIEYDVAMIEYGVAMAEHGVAKRTSVIHTKGITSRTSRDHYLKTELTFPTRL